MAGTVASCLRPKDKEPTEVSSITDYLLLSGCGGLTPQRLESLGVTAAVCCIKGVKHKFPDSIEYLYVPVEDDEGEDLRPYMAQVLELIDRHRRAGVGQGAQPCRTLVYCGLGISRSATFVIAYLMRYDKLSLLDAYKFVQKRRPIICPNVGFFKQLIDAELALFGKQTVNIIKPVDNVEVPDVIWDEVYQEVVQRLNARPGAV